MAEACAAETGLLDEPLQGMQGRLEQLLADWPDNPILTQLLALCARLAGERSACNCTHVSVCQVHQSCTTWHGLTLDQENSNEFYTCWETLLLGLCSTLPHGWA